MASEDNLTKGSEHILHLELATFAEKFTNSTSKYEMKSRKPTLIKFCKSDFMVNSTNMEIIDLSNCHKIYNC